MSYRLALACAASLAWLSAQPPTLEQQIEKALASPAARQASWGIHVVDLAAGTVLYARGADVPMTPASNTKLFTTALQVMESASAPPIFVSHWLESDAAGPTYLRDSITTMKT